MEQNALWKTVFMMGFADTANFTLLGRSFLCSKTKACAEAWEKERVVEFLPAGYSAGRLVCLQKQQMAMVLGC